MWSLNRCGLLNRDGLVQVRLYLQIYLGVCLYLHIILCMIDIVSSKTYSSIVLMAWIQKKWVYAFTGG